MIFSSSNNLMKNIDNVLIETIKNRLSKNKIIWMSLDKIIIDPEIENIFIQKETDIQNIANNMLQSLKSNKQAFDPTHPIILAHSKVHPELNNINADGHTRYKAALRVGLKKVAIIYKEFSDREELFKFVYEQSLLRRNLTESEIFRYWEALNCITNKNGKKAKSDTEIAEELQVSRRQVAKMKEVVKKAPVEVIEQVKSGTLTVNKAYTQIKDAEKIISKPDENKKQIETQSLVRTNPKTKYSKDFIDGYTSGWMYVYESLRCGKLLNELQSEFAELKTGTKTVESLQNFLFSRKEFHEQKPTE